MGGACTRRSEERHARPELLSDRARLAPHQPAIRASDGRLTPLPLLDLCAHYVSQNLGAYPKLQLTANVTGKVLAHLVSRAWLDFDALCRLRNCPILALEVPGLAQADHSWTQAICNSHAELIRLDLSAAPTLPDVGIAPIGRLPALRSLNLSACALLTDAALAHLSAVATLEMLKLEALPNITDAGVAHLEPLHQLRWLSLSGCTQLTATAVGSVARLGGTSLRHLHLQKLGLLTGAAVHSLGSLAQLRTLRLGWCHRIPSVSLTALGSLEHLTCLDLAHTQLDDTTLADLATRLPRLRDLSLRGCPITDGGIARCRGWPRLERLSLRTCEVGNGAINALLTMRRLRDLDLAYTDLSDAGLTALAPLRKLRSLSLDSCRLSAFGLETLTAFPKLHTLDLSDVEAPRFTAGILASLPHLTSLNLFYVGIADEAVVHLTRLRNLTDLNLDSRFITDAAMPALSTIPSLTKLDLFGARLTDLGTRFLRKLTGLAHLEICGGGITDETVAIVATLPELRTVNLSQNGGITDRASGLISSLPVLESLNLSNTNIGPGSLPSLALITSLTSLSLYSCAFAASHTAALRAALPRLLSLGVDEPV